tara:strand:+ start:488 stop:4426 length:3939 start_codon:yes stop_codon:yes gene_type:complete
MIYNPFIPSIKFVDRAVFGGGEGGGLPVKGLYRGGDVPRKTNIGGQDHELSYINPEEKQLLLDMGGSGEPGPGGIPAYPIAANNGAGETRQFSTQEEKRTFLDSNPGWVSGTYSPAGSSNSGAASANSAAGSSNSGAGSANSGAGSSNPEGELAFDDISTNIKDAARLTSTIAKEQDQYDAMKEAYVEQNGVDPATGEAIPLTTSQIDWLNDKQYRLDQLQDTANSAARDAKIQSKASQDLLSTAAITDPAQLTTKSDVSVITGDETGTKIEADDDGLLPGQIAGGPNLAEIGKPGYQYTSSAADKASHKAAVEARKAGDATLYNALSPVDKIRATYSFHLAFYEEAGTAPSESQQAALNTMREEIEALTQPTLATDGSSGIGTTTDVDAPDDLEANLYDAKTSIGDVTKALDEGIDTLAGSDMLETIGDDLPRDLAGNPETGKGPMVFNKTKQVFEYQKAMAVPMGMQADGTPYPPKFETVELTPEELAERTDTKLEDFTITGAAVSAVKGTVSDEAQVTAAEGEVSAESLADTMGVDVEFIQEVVAGTRTVTDEELSKAAKRSGTPKAEIQKMLKDYQEVEGATFNKDTRPELKPQDLYNLTPTQIAEQTATTVRDAAKATEYPTTTAATSDFESTVKAAQGTVGADELVNAEDIIGTAKAVQAVAATDKALNDESIAIAAQGSLSQAALAKAQTGSVSPQATVAGQMSTLMEQFNDGTPAWAAGAMRAANAAMAARGMGASSMASSAIIQAAMESAIPIASADAQTFANMDMQNLNNQQQVSLANAAAQQNMTLANLNNQQQAMLQNSTNAFSLQSQNLSNTQATVLANAQLKSAFQNKTLDIKTQTSLANAAKFAEMNQINLTNRQQAGLQRSAENLQVEMANLSNKQQTQLSNLQVRAALVGQELTNEQQMAVLASTQDFERANFDASAKQQAFLQDAQSTAALEGKAMDIRQQTAVFNVSAQLEERKIELSNQQEATLFNTTNKVNIDLAELSNRQQTALANAQIDAALEGKELDNRQQTAVLNAEKFAEAANLTFTAEQNAQLHNSELLKSIGIAELSTNATIALQNAATVAGMDLANLSNTQQAAVVNAQNFLKMDLANLTNEQEVSIFKAQAIQQAILTDQAAENAAIQFNASSKNQTEQFMATLATNVTLANAKEKNAMSALNAGEVNAMSKFNTEQNNAYDQFLATNSMLVAQSNAKWRQDVVTSNQAAQNESNLADAKAINSFTAEALNNIWQRDRDLMSFAWQSSENYANNVNNIILAEMSATAQTAAATMQAKASSSSLLGQAAVMVVGNWINPFEDP